MVFFIPYMQCCVDKGWNIGKVNTVLNYIISDCGKSTCKISLVNDAIASGCMKCPSFTFCISLALDQTFLGGCNSSQWCLLVSRNNLFICKSTGYGKEVVKLVFAGAYQNFHVLLRLPFTCTDVTDTCSLISIISNTVKALWWLRGWVGACAVPLIHPWNKVTGGIGRAA